MLTLARTGIVRGLQQIGYGYIEWNLPEALEYQAGQTIPMVLKVTNPGLEAREYQLYLGLYNTESGELIPDTLQLLLVNEEEGFTISGESYVEMEGEVIVDRANIILAIMLYDVASETTPGYVSIMLTAAAAELNLVPVINGMFGIAALGMMVPTVIEIFKE